MVEDWSVGDELGLHMRAQGMSLDRLARASGVPRGTIHRWRNGLVDNPYYRENMLKVAAALNLSRVETDRLLYCIHSPLTETLYARADDERRELMARWMTPARNNLPGDLTSFIGRQVELLQIASLLGQDDVRLVTLTGPGGVGKTRLSLKVAGELHDVFTDGIFFVPLATVTDPGGIAPAIAQALDIRDVPGQSTDERLMRYLRSRRILLVLDNVEHLVEAAPGVVELLSAAHHLTVLATSRIPLRVSCEHVRPVAYFDPPVAAGKTSDLTENHAVQLFAERAQAVSAGFSLNDLSACSVVEICERLEGSPLAIELAAARCRRFTPAELLEHFPSRLELGADGSSDRPDRHRSLRAAIDWSFALLSPPAQTLFTRLAVFRGGWSQAGMEAVCGGHATTLQELVDASLVARVPGGRFSMLETIREYAHERLSISGQAADLEGRHQRYMLALAESAQPYVPQVRQMGWLGQIDQEYVNIRAALEHARKLPDTTLFLRLVVALWPFWHEYGRFVEGLEWLEQALALADGRSDHILASLQSAAAVLTYSRGDVGTSLAHGDAALDLWRRRVNHHGMGLILGYQGMAHYSMGDLKTAMRLYHESLTHWRAADEPLGAARFMSEMAILLGTSGHVAEARAHLQSAESIYFAHNESTGIARSKADAGLFAMLNGEMDVAVPMLVEAVEHARALGDNHHLGWILFYLGASLCFAGELDAAEAALVESLDLLNESVARYGMAYTLLGFAALRHRQGRPSDAAALCGAVTSLLEMTGISMNPAVEQIYGTESAAVRESLGEAAFTSAYAAGREMTPDDAYVFARRSG